MDTWKNTEADGYPPTGHKVRVRFQNVERDGYTGIFGDELRWYVTIEGTDYPMHQRAVREWRERQPVNA